jgi:CRP-like cAMP-binding protein
MSSPHTYSNQILASLAAKDFARLEPHLQHITLNVRQEIEDAGEPIQFIYFPLSGMVSIVAHEGGNDLEVGIVGRDGMTGTSVVLGSDTAPHESFVQVMGDAVRIATTEFKRAVAESPSLNRPFLAYVGALLRQTAQTAVANGRCTIDQRLARWLLMTQDRIGGNEVPLTHEFLSLMLGVRRPGITVAVHTLEKEGAVHHHRGVIAILDREKLEGLAGGAYRRPDPPAARAR